jgi:hypothetical protein
MKIIPGNTPVILDGLALRAVQSLEFERVPNRVASDIYVTIVVKLDNADCSAAKIELSSFTA